MLRLFYDTRAKRLGPLLRGHLVLYERRDAPAYTARAGLLLLAAVLVLELVIGPRMEGFALLGLPAPPPGLRTLALVVLAVTMVKLAGLNRTDIGLIPFAQWRAAETLYLAQALLVGGGVFYLVFAARLGLGEDGAWLVVGGYVLTQLLWGFYQELVYRGMLQTELTRRFGGVAGVLITNLAFTFGPLHFYHLQNATDPTQTALMMAAIFAVGLLFAYIFARCRNVWLVGLLHGIGNVFGNLGGLGSG